VHQRDGPEARLISGLDLATPLEQIARELVHHRRDGRQTHYSARPQALKPLANWMTLYGAFWRDRFDRLEDLLNRMDQ